MRKLLITAIITLLFVAGCSLQQVNTGQKNNHSSNSYCADLVAKALSVNYSVRGSFECTVSEYQFASQIRGHGNDKYLENTTVDSIKSCTDMTLFSPGYFYKGYIFSGTDNGVLLIFVSSSQGWKVNTFLSYFNVTCSDIPKIINLLQGRMNGS